MKKELMAGAERAFLCDMWWGDVSVIVSEALFDRVNMEWGENGSSNATGEHSAYFLLLVAGAT